jgi:release factor glutamine methyltransferase
MQATIELIRSELQGLYPDTEIRSFTKLLISKLTGFSNTEIILNKNTIFSAEQRKILDSFIEKLKIHMPIQYILGKTEFYGLEFIVNQSVLIPRPETEELVEWILNSIHDNSNLKLLDIGTGSGCIAIGLKNNLTQSQVTAFDISEDALLIAQKNAELNNLKINFEQVDILKNLNLNEKWDVIVSNPPYIPENEKIEISQNVLDFEPHLALFVPEIDPLVFYKKIADFGKAHLNENGSLFFEIHYTKANQIIELLKSLGYFEIELRKDIYKNDRMIKAKLA